jgi:hypothetical protein
MEVAMKESFYKAAYIAAMDAATLELHGLFEEAARLRTRMESIHSVIDALKPLFADSDSALSPEISSGMNPVNQQVNAGLDMVFV